jgi:hypothetical protein
MLILYGALIFWLGLVIGFLLMWWRMHKYSGTIHVMEDERLHKTVYTLELDDYPETLRLKKVVVFKVDSPEDRE